MFFISQTPATIYNGIKDVNYGQANINTASNTSSSANNNAANDWYIYLIVGSIIGAIVSGFYTIHTSNRSTFKSDLNTFSATKNLFDDDSLIDDGSDNDDDITSAAPFSLPVNRPTVATIPTVTTNANTSRRSTNNHKVPTPSSSGLNALEI